MRTVFPWGRWELGRIERAAPRSWARALSEGPLVAALALASASAPSMIWAQAPSPRPAQAPPASSKATSKAAGAPAPGQAAAPAPAPDTAGVEEADPSQTRKIAPIEVFKDPAVEKFDLLNLDRYRELSARPFTNQEVLLVKQMAGDPNTRLDRLVVERVVQGLAAKLTEHKAIKALVDPPPPLVLNLNEMNEKKKRDAAKRKEARVNAAHAEAAQALSSTTANLLEPLFRARAAHNAAFLKVYHRALVQYLQPLLNNTHLLTRVQAMIVLGESGAPEALALFETQIRDPKQSLWVKWWALEGITTIKREGGRYTVDAESKAAKLVSEFLDRSTSLPWPIQLRGLEALGALRQGFLPNQPSQAHMANTAMRFLDDGEARPEVRAEAARSLGLMPISSAVSGYNYSLVAFEAGRLALALAQEVDALHTASPDPKKPSIAENPDKARYLTALLVGPLHQCFTGVKQFRDSGLLKMSDPKGRVYVQKVYELIGPVSQACVDLIGAPPKLFGEKKKPLAAAIGALRSFLEQNGPESRKLVPRGEEFAAAGPAPASSS